MKFHSDIIVIGAGAAGLVVASVAAQLGLRVTLIENDALLGGDCLHYGCVPSKALLHAASIAHTIRSSHSHGFHKHDPGFDIADINAQIKIAIDTIQPNDSRERFESLGCEVITGSAKFVDSRRVEVNGKTLSAKRFVIATGSEPLVPKIPGLSDIEFLTNKDMYSLDSVPERLAIIGGGPIGIEMAQAYSRLGSKVSVIELAPTILPLEDEELSTMLMHLLSEEGIAFHLGSGVKRVESTAGAIKVWTENNESVEADKLLLALGRMPSVENLHLDDAGVRYTTRGIEVDARMRTSRKHIFACGDVTGPYRFTHTAEQQAGVVIANTVFHLPRKIDYRVVPRIVFCEPEFAHVGLTEKEAQDAGRKIKVISFPLKELDRAIADNNKEGKIKLMVEKGRLVGASLLAPRAGEVIHELALAMQEKTKISRIGGMIHAYPGYSQIVRRAVSSSYSDAFYSRKVKWLVKVLNRLLP